MTTCSDGATMHHVQIFGVRGAGQLTKVFTANMFSM
jgi:hypothetical protein